MVFAIGWRRARAAQFCKRVGDAVVSGCQLESQHDTVATSEEQWAVSCQLSVRRITRRAHGRCTAVAFSLNCAARGEGSSLGR
jgi:hypothetical protein